MKKEPIIVYVYHGQTQEVPWREIKRAIAAQLAPDAALALTITCNAIGKGALFGQETVEDGSTASTARGPVTITDVARAANVSNSTVSRVLNDDMTVSPKTRARVEEAVRRMAYIPNEAARTMVRSKRVKQSIFGLAEASPLHDLAEQD